MTDHPFYHLLFLSVEACDTAQVASSVKHAGPPIKHKVATALHCHVSGNPVPCSLLHIIKAVCVFSGFYKRGEETEAQTSPLSTTNTNLKVMTTAADPPSSTMKTQGFLSFIFVLFFICDLSLHKQSQLVHK